MSHEIGCVRLNKKLPMWVDCIDTIDTFNNPVIFPRKLDNSANGIEFRYLVIEIVKVRGSFMLYFICFVDKLRNDE